MIHDSRWSFSGSIVFYLHPFPIIITSIAVLSYDEDIDITVFNAAFEDEQFSDAPHITFSSHISRFPVCIQNYVVISQFYYSPFNFLWPSSNTWYASLCIKIDFFHHPVVMTGDIFIILILGEQCT